MLTRVFPADVMDQVTEGAGRTEQRKGSSPARVTAYFSIGMALHADGSYENVFAELTDGLAWSSGGAESWPPPSESAIFQTPSRLGFEPRCVTCSPGRPPRWPSRRQRVRGSRDEELVAIDGTVLDLADTPANADFFGRPPSSRASMQRLENEVSTGNAGPRTCSPSQR